MDTWSVWSCTSRRRPSRTSCSGAAGRRAEEEENEEEEQIRRQCGEADQDATCLRPRVLVSHICLMFQKNGCSHFWQESLSSHCGACRARTPCYLLCVDRSGIPRSPLRQDNTNLFSRRVHVPDGDASVGRARQQLSGELEVAQRLDAIAETEDRRNLFKPSQHFSLSSCMFTFCNGSRLLGLIYLPITVLKEKKSDYNMLLHLRLLIFKSSDSSPARCTAASRLSFDV